MLVSLVITLLVSSAFTSTSALDYNDYALQRIARAPHQSSALLVPFPRVGKRSNSEKSSQPKESDLARQHLFMARLGNKAFIFSPRMGK